MATPKKSLASRAGSVVRRAVGRGSADQQPSEDASTAPATKSAPASEAVPAKKTTAKKATPAKRTAATKTSAEKAPAAKKSTPAAKATSDTETAPTKTVAKKTAATKTAATKTAAKKTAKKASATRSAPAEKAAATEAAPAKKTAAKKTPAKKTPAKKTPAKKTPAKKTPAKKAAGTGSPARPGDLVVREGEDRWTAAELGEVREHLEDDVARLTAELESADSGLHDLMVDSGDGSGHDQADVGSSSFERDHELSIANNARDMLDQSRHALERIADGSYGVCERNGEPIGKLRLMAFPRATLCMTCKQREERR